MDNFESLFDRFTKEEENINITPKNDFPYFKEDNGVLLEDYNCDGKYYLSECIKESNVPTKRINVTTNISLIPGLLGIYRHAYPKTEVNDYGYLEEMRVVVKISLYSNYLMLYLSPIKYLEYTDIGLQCEYIDCNIVKLILIKNDIPATWIKLDKGYKFVKGCSFQPSNILLGRTFVKDGQFVEKEGRKFNRSSNLIIPPSFVHLFEQSLNEDNIIW